MQGSGSHIRPGRGAAALVALLGCHHPDIAGFDEMVPDAMPMCAGPGGRGFAFTGGPQVFVVPECVTRLTVELWGAQGGPSRCSTDEIHGLPDVQMDGGLGGWLRAELPVRPGEVLLVLVGGRGGIDGAPGWNGGGRGGVWGGGGGGGSDIRIGGASLIDRALVVGGGGGGSCGFPDHGAGGHGGGLVGEDGVVGDASWNAGGGGKQHAGGVAGSSPGQTGVFGLGGGAARYHVAGGGGGWYGGGGAFGAGGGGGSSHVAVDVEAVAFEAGARGGDGAIQIFW
ncbi:Glycine rich protein [Nannocystis exedens]|uniref:receptor protein-tyrosine kinase n=1 Tax=Nannocystis exedens TaxID=54 RepID=A0A1I2H3D9_9BACT|nr:glycine-rich protein [Nannocystis exedens]PCC67071.1 Glycine rich protein [Nannocystis exedens]SFF23316.1 Glycine rich protein [Nannocystis exedens]